jgi:hypothetical protein
MKEQLISKYESYIKDAEKWFDLPDIPFSVQRSYRGRVIIYQEVIEDLKMLPDTE